MFPNQDSIPLDDFFNKDNIIFDTIYNPLKTKWLNNCEKQGATIIGGLDMLIGQGIASVNIWLGRNIINEINVKLIKDTLEKELC